MTVTELIEKLKPIAEQRPNAEVFMSTDVHTDIDSVRYDSMAARVYLE
jgi:hypothetical protein